jgi:N,N'-diacetyllegionaminate synthase
MSHDEQSVCIIAEVGSVHDGSFGNAQRLIDVAAECGADVVKFQTHLAEAETLRDAPTPPYFKGEARFEYFERTAFTLEQIKLLKLHCEERGVEFLSSPFSIEAVHLLERVGVSRYKIPSGEVSNLPYLDVVAQTGKPIILSSGMSSWAELDEAVNTILRHHANLTVLQCTSEYPCPYEEVGLNVMLDMKTRYQLPVGLSDHTLTIYASLAAVTLGASIIERHLSFSRLMYGSDAKHSLEPAEFTDLVRGIRAIEKMQASAVDKDDIARFATMKATFEKSIVAVVDIPQGAVITYAMLGFKKPGTGIPAKHVEQVVGKRARQRIAEDSLIREQDLIE